MEKKKDRPSEVSTCFEGLPFAERLQQIMAEGGIGSLSEELMRSWMTRCGEGRQAGPRSKTAFKPAQGRKNIQRNGGLK